MEIGKIAALGIIGAALAVILREERRSYAMLTAIMTCILIFVFILPYMAEIIEKVREIGGDLNIYSEYIAVMIKALAIAYVSMFTSQLCRDFGQNSIGDKIELGGKVIILINAVSVIDDVADKIMRFIQ